VDGCRYRRKKHANVIDLGDLAHHDDHTVGEPAYELI
jgi:hypothetical protein